MTEPAILSGSPSPVLIIRSKYPLSSFLKIAGSDVAKKRSAPNFNASSCFFSEGLKTVTSAPNSCAIFTPICPRPPSPMMASFLRGLLSNGLGSSKYHRCFSLHSKFPLRMIVHASRDHLSNINVNVPNQRQLYETFFTTIWFLILYLKELLNTFSFTSFSIVELPLKKLLSDFYYEKSGLSSGIKCPEFGTVIPLTF